MKKNWYQIKLLLFIFVTLSVQICKAISQQYYSFNNTGGVTQKLCVRSILQSEDGMIWLATESGLYSYDGYHLIKRPIDETIIKGESTGSFNCLLNNGDSLLIGCNKGLLSFNLNTYAYHYLPYARGEIVKDIACESSSNWVATESGIYKDGAKLKSSPQNIVSVYSDNNFLYIGTTDAVHRYSINKQQSEKIIGGIPYATCFYNDIHNDFLWIGTAANVMVWSKKSMKIVFTIPMPVAKSICKDKSGNMLVGTDNGLYLVGNDHKAKAIFHDARRENSLAGDAVWSIFRDRVNNIWIGTNSGVSVLPDDGLITTCFLPSLTGEGTGNQIFCTYIDSKGRQWLGGGNGILCIEKPGKKDHNYRWYRMSDPRYTIPHNRIRDIFEDSKGNILIGGDMGLMLYDEDSKQFKRYDIKEDPDNWVYSIGETSDHDFIITTFTSTYIATLDSASYKVIIKKTKEQDNTKEKSNNERYLLEKYGLSETYLSAFFDSINGKILLGGTDRFSILNINKLEEARSKLNLSITDIIINGNRYINHEIIKQGKATILPGDRIIEILFSDFNLSGVLSPKYLYRIDDGEWVPVNSGNNVIMLTNLKPGKYNIYISFSDNIKDEIIFTLTIKAPWFATIFAKMTYLIFFICLIYGFYYIIQQRRRIAQERKENQELLFKAKQKEKELLSDNEYLAVQLKLQLQAKAGEHGVLSEDEKFLLKITSIIEDNMSDYELNVDSLCKLSGFTSKQLYRKIKAMTGMTTVAYIRDQRLKKAASLLAKGTFTVSEVTYMVGFSNPGYFSRCFIEEYKISPSEYKK